jgi:Protein kinase domain
MLDCGHELAARYVLVRRLGGGGSGEVWLARDRERGNHVALKVLADQLAISASACDAVAAACARAAGLEHANLLRTGKLERAGSSAFIAMEFAAGGDLAAFRGRPSVEVLRLALPVARGLECLHSAGLVHRDVKTSNVLLSGVGTPKLADFLELLPQGEVPDEGTSSGSPYSASPQQLTGGAASYSDDVYGFGVLLYELISGYPPFYPDVTAERVRAEAPAPLASRHGVPERLAALVERCLAKDAAARPRDGAVLVRELESIDSDLRSAALQASPSLSPPVPSGVSIRPQWQRPPVVAPSDARQLESAAFRRGLLGALAVLLVLAAGVVFFVLPRWAERREPAPVAAQAPAPAKAAASATEEPVDYAALAELQRQAEDLRGQLDPRVQSLAARGAARWGQPDLGRVRDGLAAGDASFAARSYADALAAFKTAGDLVASLESRVPQVLAKALADGDQAIADGRSDDAAAAFQLALALDPGNAHATKGSARAATLDKVLGLVARAELSESEERLAEARDAFAEAARLDGDMTRATTGLARVAARIAADEFAALLARGFAAQSGGDRTAARKAFQEAKRMRPAAPEPARALAQLDQEQRTDTIAADLDQARQLEADEKWKDALEIYRKVLALDSTVAFAQEGVARVEPRVALNDELELYLTQPERLFSAPVRAAAHDALARAAAIAPAGPVLRKQVQTLEGWLRRAETPIAVALVSDNVTRVTIYRVGELGTFANRSLELLPGRYTVVGTRPGYRDVRRELEVVPGAAPPQLVIRCEERI